LRWLTDRYVHRGQEEIFMSRNLEAGNPSSPPNGFAGGGTNEPKEQPGKKDVEKMPSKPNKGKGAEGDGEEE